MKKQNYVYDKSREKEIKKHESKRSSNRKRRAHGNWNF